MREMTLDGLRTIGGMKWSRFPDQIGAWVAEMDFGLAPPISAALHRMIDDGLTGYLPVRLADDLAEATAAWYAETYGWDLAAGQVRALPDVIKGFEEAITTFSAPGSAIVLPTPAYMPFLKVPGLYDREIIEVPMIRDDTEWRLDLDAIDAAFTAGGGLLVMCNPHNPIGKVYSAEEMRAVAEIVDRHGGRVFSDEIHAPLVFSGHRHVPYAAVSDTAAGHTVTATSASKAWNLPGLKCAQLIFSNDADIQTFDKEGFWASHGTATPGVVANIAAYREGGPWLTDVLDYLAGNHAELQRLLAGLLPEVGYLPVQGTYLALLDCRGLGIDDPTAFFAGEAKIALTDGAACGRAAIGHVRLNFAMPRPLLRQTVQAMASAVTGRR